MLAQGPEGPAHFSVVTGLSRSEDGTTGGDTELVHARVQTSSTDTEGDMSRKVWFPNRNTEVVGRGLNHTEAVTGSVTQSFTKVEGFLPRYH